MNGADVLRETGHKDEAILMYQRCLALDPANKAAREKLEQPDK